MRTICAVEGCAERVFAGTLCYGHLFQARSAAGARGGAASAQRRQAAKVGCTYDVSQILQRGKAGPGGIWVGAKPPLDQALPTFHTLILCAAEIQPHRPDIAFAGRIIHCPLDDARPSELEVNRALAASRRCAEEVRNGATVLVTCQMGLNRSALVAALAILRLTKMDGERVIAFIRQQRNPQCLFNAHFRGVIERFAASPRR